MSDGPILITGATGFVGGRVLQRLHDAGRPLRALVRHPAHADLPPGVDVVQGDLTDEASLRRACDGASAVVSAAAVTGALRPPPGGYDRVNADGIAALARAATAAGVGRLVHFGGIDPGGEPGPYLRGRRRGEAALRAAGVPWTILQPSVQFGPGSEFVARLVPLVKLPVTPVAGNGKVRIQLIHVDDVARCTEACLDGDARLGRTIELGGPHAWSFDEILDIMGRALGKPRVLKLHAPLRVVAAQARLLVLMPSPSITPATLELIARDNLAASFDVVEREFGFAPRRFDEHVAQHGLEVPGAP